MTSRESERKRTLLYRVERFEPASHVIWSLPYRTDRFIIGIARPVIHLIIIPIATYSE